MLAVNALHILIIVQVNIAVRAPEGGAIWSRLVNVGDFGHYWLVAYATALQRQRVLHERSCVRPSGAPNHNMPELACKLRSLTSHPLHACSIRVFQSSNRRALQQPLAIRHRPAKQARAINLVDQLAGSMSLSRGVRKRRLRLLCANL